MTEEKERGGLCPNQHEMVIQPEVVVAEYPKSWRVRCPECRVIYSVSKK